jgi:hypothetical protein
MQMLCHFRFVLHPAPANYRQVQTVVVSKMKFQCQMYAQLCKSFMSAFTLRH